MLIFKCKCGSLFTTSNNRIERSGWLTCQGCGNKTPHSGDMYVSDFESEIEKSGFTITKVPDNAKLTVKFDT